MLTQSPTRSVVACAIFACVVAVTLVTNAQAQRPAGQQTPDKVVVSADEVLFDVVVRDKKGRLLTNLTPADFEVYEDGVRQGINSFRLAAPASAGTVGSSSTTSAVYTDNKRDESVAGTTKTTEDRAEGPGISAVALVFDRLSPEARTRATQAALAYVQESSNSNELVGVFLTDLSNVVLQQFTNDRQLVKSGIEKAGVHNPSLYASTNEKAREKRSILTNALVYEQNGLSEPRGSQSLSSRSAGLAFTRMELLMLESAEQDQRDQMGEATARGLLLIASALRAVPGRKAIIFFSEGLVLPPSVMGTFPAIISAANRNNVSVYTVDAAGLRVESKTGETNREMSSRSEYRMSQLGSLADPEGPMTKGLERNEDLLRLNPDSGLGLLASETGGFLITDSNDLKDRLRQVDEDLHSYYLMSYQSSNQNYDGRFRKIDVKVKRSGVSIQSRRGYYALKGQFASPVLTYEVPALAARERKVPTNSFPFYAGGFNFPERERTGRTAFLVDVPLSAFTFNPDHEKKLYSTDFSIVALIKDQAGQVVEKVSKQYRLSGPLDTTDQTKQSRALFYQEADLGPGSYTMETIAYDAPSGRASVRSNTFNVAEGDEAKLRLSDVVMLKRAEPATAADEKRSNPFQVGNLIVSPNLGEPIRRSLKQVPFFFTVYQLPGASIRPKLTIELQQGGRTLAQIPGEMPAADAAGRIQYVAALPVENIPAGSYDLTITVRDQTTTVSRSRSLTIEE